jgi:IclR family acetate operon transcriptional repressor
MPNVVQDTDHNLSGLAAAPRTRSTVPAVTVACRILDALARPGIEGVTLTELARELELPKSTVHGQLATLQANGLVHRDDASRRVRLGAALISLGLAAGRQLRTTAIVSERLPALAGQEQVTFAVAQVTEPRLAIVVDRAYPAADVHIGLTLGSRYGVFDGAIGKCLLAGMAPEQAEQVVGAAEIPSHTERTIVDGSELLAEVARVRAQGWASSARELKENHALAAPLWNSGGELELVIVAVGFPSQLPEDRFPGVGDLLADTARSVEALVGRAAGTPDIFEPGD